MENNPALFALALMAWQYLEQDDGFLDHKAMCAGEEAIEVLAQHGLVVSEGRGGRWTEKGLALLDRSDQPIEPE